MLSKKITEYFTPDKVSCNLSGNSAMKYCLGELKRISGVGLGGGGVGENLTSLLEIDQCIQAGFRNSIHVVW